MPETNRRLSARSRRSSRQTLGTPASATLLVPAGRSAAPRRRTPASSRTSVGGLADELVARLAELELARDQGALGVVDDGNIAGRGRGEIVAAGKLGIVELEPQVDREVRRGGEADAAAAADRAAAGAAAQLADLEPRGIEATAEREVGDPRAVLLVDVGEVVGAHQADETGRLEAAVKVGGDDDRPAQLMAGEVGQGHRNVGRAVVADAAGERARPAAASTSRRRRAAAAAAAPGPGR